MNAEDLMIRWRAMQGARGQLDQHCQELAEVMLPSRADFTTNAQAGGKRTTEILDGTPAQAAHDLAVAMHSMLFPTHYFWSKIGPVDDDLEDDDEVNRWCEHVDNRMRGAIYDPKAQFAGRAWETDEQLVVFGTGILFIGTNTTGDRLVFDSHHLKDCCLAEAQDGNIDTIYMRRMLTARQAVQLGYESKAITEALRKNDPEQKCEYLHVVMPRKDRDTRRIDNKSMPFAHYVVDTKESKLVEESGFHEFPFAVPRWETASEEVYGRSPGMMALPDARQLMEMRRTTMAAAQLAIDPPWAVPNDTTINEQSLYPGGLMSYDPTSVTALGGARNAFFAMHSGAEINLGLEMENQTRDMIRSAFLKTVLNLPTDGPQMTATEILQRREEFMRMVGPTFGRLEDSYPGAIANRVFGIMMRAGAFDDPPDVLNGRRVDFEFRSAVQAAQKRIASAAVQATMVNVMGLAQADPGVLDNFDFDRIARDDAEANGMPSDHLRGQDAVAEMRKQRAEQQAAQQAAMLAAQAAESAGKAAPMVSAMQGGQAA